MKRTPLKRFTILKAHKPINKVSKKQKLRNEILAAIKPPKDNRCQKCGQFADFFGLQKHHKIFRSQGGTDDLENIIWLCNNCHTKVHAHK